MNVYESLVNNIYYMEREISLNKSRSDTIIERGYDTLI